MGDERIRNILFHLLGCGKEDVRRILKVFTNRYLQD